MLLRNGIFSPDANVEDRIILDYGVLKDTIAHLKGLKQKVVLTMGTFDMTHIGHGRYIREARTRGDVLLVGVDSDAKVRQRKGPSRPIWPQDERLEMLAHTRYVDVLTLKDITHEHWELIRTVRPDVLIATSGTYSDAEVQTLLEFCGKVEVLDPMATTTTSAKIRLLQIEVLRPAVAQMRRAIDEIEKGFPK